jgi:hypothetical protein
MMSQHLTRPVSSGLTASLGASHVKTSALPGSEMALMGSDRACGESMPESFAWYDPDTSSWRTYQACFALIENDDGQPPLDEYSETWPSAGTMQNGRVSRLGSLDQLNCADECSLSPTLTTRDWKDGRCSDATYSKNSRPLNEVIQRLQTTPTLRATETDSGDYQRDGGQKGKERLTLKGVLDFSTPTLTASAAGRGPEKLSTRAKREGAGGATINDVIGDLSGRGGGVLNPTWCEWYMGFPANWSAIESPDSETA